MHDIDTVIASRHRSEVIWLRIVLAVTLLLLGVGLVAPIITLTKFVLVENTFSVLSGVMELFREGQYFLFVIITGFSVVLPLIKIAILAKILGTRANHSATLEKYLHWMYSSWLSWSFP